MEKYGLFCGVANIMFTDIGNQFLEILPLLFFFLHFTSPNTLQVAHAKLLS